jgi:uncharacterized delta-60 repeat protein
VEDFQIRYNRTSELLEKVAEKYYQGDSCACQHPRFIQIVGINCVDFRKSFKAWETTLLISKVKKNFEIETLEKGTENSNEKWTCKKCKSEFNFGWSDFSIAVEREVLLPIDIKTNENGKKDIMKNQIIFLFILYNTIVFSQSAGSLDPSFGNGGIVILNDYQSTGNDIALLSDGKILVVGEINTVSLLKFNSDGSQNTTFTSANSTIFGVASSMKIQVDGKILITGYRYSGTGFILRYNSDGTLDSNFGTGGVLDVTLKYVYKIEIDNVLNKIVIGGLSRIGTNDYFSLARYNMDGNIDNTFNGNGIKLFTPNYSLPKLMNIQIDSFSRISACGSYHFDSNYYSSFATNNWLCRVNSDGSMDTSFSDDGLLTVDSGTYFNEKFNESNAMLLKSDGSLLVAGTKGVDPYFGRDFSLYEVSSVGTLTPNMPLNYGFTNNKSDIATSIAKDNNGKFVLAGKTGNGVYQNSYAVLRLNQDYTTDTTFGVNGRVETFSQDNDNKINNIVIQPDNKIVAIGSVRLGSDLSFPTKLCLVRYLASDSLETNEFENDNGFQVFPNPVSKNLNLSFNTLPSLKSIFQITDVNGRVILTGNIENDKMQINVESLSKGIYFLKINNNIKTKKIIKN